MILEYTTPEASEILAVSNSIVDTELKNVKLQVQAAQNSEKLYKYLLYIDKELWQITASSREDFSLKIISLFEQIFDEDKHLQSYERQEIITRFQKALDLYHSLFSETTWQKYFRGNTPSTLMILGDTWYIWYSKQWESDYRFI